MSIIPGLSDAVAPDPTSTAFPAVDTFTIAALTLPGKWTLLEAKKQFGWQIQQGYGLSGAYVFPKGDPLVVAKFKGEFWAQSDWQIFTLMAKTVLAKGSLTQGPTAAGMGIDHPELKRLGVTDVVVLEQSALVNDGYGLWTLHVDFLQYRPPLPAPPKPTFVVPDTAAPKPTALTAQQIELQKLQGQAATLLGQL